jgi:hypothetical protein
VVNKFVPIYFVVNPVAEKEASPELVVLVSTRV